MPMEDEANGSGATEIAPTPSAAPSRFQPRTLKVRGQEFVIDSPEKEEQLLSKGASYERENQALKEERKRIAEEKQALEAQRARITYLEQVDERLRSEPETRAKVNAVLNGQPLPEDNLSDDPILRELETRDRQSDLRFRRLEQALNQVSQHLTQGLGGIRRERTLDSEERQLKGRYPKVATDERIDEARLLAEERGLSLMEAFKLATFDELPDLVRSDVIQELGVDPTSIGPQRGDHFVADGIGPMDEGKLNDLFETDPDRYARLRPQLRDWRLTRRGKVQVPR